MSVKGNAINWQEVKSRLRGSELALEEALTTSPERAEATFRDRAVQLAGRLAFNATPTETLRMMAFRVGGERYGIEIADIVELLPFANCAPIPGAPRELLGATNIHGEIRSVLHLGRLLNLPEVADSGPGYILLLRKQNREAALRVDEIDKIQVIPADDLIAAGDADAVSNQTYLKGLTPDRLKLLNTDALFTHSIFAKRVSP